MKTKLNTIQSQHLIDLGVPKEKASGVISTGPIGANDRGILNIPSQPVFRLEDFLNGEILPKEIGKIGAPEDEENIVIWWLDDVWNVAYALIREFHADELIDALYKLTCWYYGVYLKEKENGNG